MTRVLVVSRNPAMAMGLSSTDCDITELRPAGFGEWISGPDDADALILDLESPALAAAAVRRLRERDKLAPVLLVSSDHPGWDDPAMSDLPAAAVLPLPITRPALLAALEQLLGATWAAATLPTPSATSVATEQPGPAPRRSRRVEPSAAEIPEPRQPAPSARGTGSAPEVDLVRALLAGADLLYGVPETAEVAVADAVERTRADAGALMVPDDGAWRVAGGLGLRPLEHRYELRGDSWLVQEIVGGNKGAIVEDSDVARERLHGAPLASWRHLLVAPVPGVDALLILARSEDPPFDEDDLSVLATIGSEARPLLQSALDTRALARRLWEFRDEPDLPR